MSEDFEDERLWKILGEARPVSVSPYFSRRVMREIRLASERPLLPPIFLRWLAAGALAVLAVGFFLSIEPAASRPIVRSSEFIETFDHLAGIDALVVSADLSLTDYSRGL
jgi:hypothetical protein